MNVTLLKMQVMRFEPYREAKDEPKYIPFEYTIIDDNPGSSVGTPVVRIGDQFMSADSFLAVADAVKRFYETHPTNVR